MKITSYGRILFGASAVFYGTIALRWYDAQTWQTLAELWKLPCGRMIGGSLMAAQIVGGIGIQSTRTARLASIILAVVYLLFSLACVPGILSAPGAYASYPNFFEQLSLLCGAIALFAEIESSAGRAALFGRSARLGLGMCTISFMLTQIVYFRATEDFVPKWIPPNPMFWAILTTIAFGLAALAILFNVRARLALRLMTLMVVLFGVLVWIPRLRAHPEAHVNWSEFSLNFLIAGAAAVVAESKLHSIR